MVAQGNDLQFLPYLVVMAGGSGTRFWPKSTSKKPKQLLKFGSEKTLLQQTLTRFDGIVSADHRLIVTTELLQDAVRAQVPSSTRVLAEPQGRNTAPCVYWAARVIADENPNAVMLVMPSDHSIPHLSSFQTTLREAIEWAKDSSDLITLGISPTRPETGYGYLKMGRPEKGHCRKVEAFIEKPGIEKAQALLASGETLWNGGMFVWKVSAILSEFDRLMPEMKKAWDEARGQVEKAYPQLTATSIDYGIMERAKSVVTFPLNCGWDDLGSWTSLENLADQLGARHSAGVVTAGTCVSLDSSGNIVDVPNKLVALLGTKDLIIVETDSTLLVAPKSAAQDIKKLVDEVKKKFPDRV